MTKQQRTAATVIAIVAALVGVFLLSKKGGLPGPAGGKGPLVKDDLAMTRILSRGKEQDDGFVYLPYTRTEDGDAFSHVNVAIDLNGDGAIAAYDVPGGRQEEWLVRNMASFATEGGAAGYPVRIPDRAIKDRLPLAATVVFSATRLEGDAWPAAPQGATSLALRVKTFEISDRDQYFHPDGSGDLDTGDGSPSRRLAVATPAPAPLLGDTGHASLSPGEPERYRAMHEDMPDQDQKYNECSPTGISDSFRWLADENGFRDRMPDGTTSLINELKGDLDWHNGVEPGQNTVDGKNAFIQRHLLPLEAHMIGSEWDNDIQYKIFQELDKGQAVEVGLAYITPDGRRDGAHLVSVAGVTKMDGYRLISLVDPGEQSHAGGLSYEVYMMDGNEVQNYDSTDKVRIRYAYAQSPVKDKGGNLVFPAGSTDFVLDPGDTLTEGGQSDTQARGDFDFFRVSVGHPGDHMVGETFTVSAIVTWTGKKTTMYYHDAAGNEQRYEFGAGKPWSVSGSFNGNDKLSPRHRGNAPAREDVQAGRRRVEMQFTCARPGLAKVTYLVDLVWPRVGPPRPEGKLEKYRAYVEETAQTMSVDSPLFRCLAPPASAEDKPKTALEPLCPGQEQDPNGVEVAVLRYGAKCYPAAQFHLAHADRCPAFHWHPNTGIAIALDGTKTPDPDPACGFGKLGEVRVGTVKLSEDQAAPFIGGVLTR